MAGIVGDDKDSPKSELSDEKDDKSKIIPVEKESSPAVTESSTNPEASATANDANNDSEYYESLDEEEDDNNNNEELSCPVTKPSKLRSKESDDDDDGIDNDNDDDNDDGSFDSRRFSNSSLEDDLSDDILIEDERLEGDGQEVEEEKNKKLDDDEDRRNPQYIPKKGTFYEHDDRTCLDSEDTTANSTESGVDSKSNDTSANRSKNLDSGNRSSNRQKQVWTDKASGDKWHHDLYVEDEQTPKTPQELIDTYGYDIRSEEAPPKARRRRKYGRGPKYYLRDWQDEHAYKGGVTSSDRRGRMRNNSNRRLYVENPAEFPDLNNRTDATQNRVRDQQQESQQRTSTTSKGREVPFKGEERDNSSSISKDVDPQPTKSILKTSNSRQDKQQQSRSRSRPRTHINSSNDGNTQAMDSYKEHVKFPSTKPVDLSSLPKHVRGRGYYKPGMIPGKMEFTPSRGRGRIATGSRMISGYSGLPARPVSDVDQMMTSVNSVTQNLTKLEITPTMSGSNLHETKRTNLIELHPAAVSLGHDKRIQEQSPSATNRSKRYSAQRQRSLPETTFSPPPAVINGPSVPPPVVPPGVLGHDPTIGYYPTSQPPPNAPQVAPVPQNPPEQFNQIGERPATKDKSAIQTVSSSSLDVHQSHDLEDFLTNAGGSRLPRTFGENLSRYIDLVSPDELIKTDRVLPSKGKDKQNNVSHDKNERNPIPSYQNRKNIVSTTERRINQTHASVPRMEFYPSYTISEEQEGEVEMMNTSNNSNGNPTNCIHTREVIDERFEHGGRALPLNEANNNQIVAQQNFVEHGGRALPIHETNHNQMVAQQNFVEHGGRALPMNETNPNQMVAQQNFVEHGGRAFPMNETHNQMVAQQNFVEHGGRALPMNEPNDNQMVAQQNVVEHGGRALPMNETNYYQMVAQQNFVEHGGRALPINETNENPVFSQQRFGQIMNATNELIVEAPSPIFFVKKIGDRFPNGTFLPIHNAEPVPLPSPVVQVDSEMHPNFVRQTQSPGYMGRPIVEQVASSNASPANCLNFDQGIFPTYASSSYSSSNASLPYEEIDYFRQQSPDVSRTPLHQYYPYPTFQHINGVVPVPDYPPPPVFNESVPPPPVTTTAMPPPPQMVAFLPPGPPPPGPPPVVPPPTAAPPFPPPAIINYVPTAAYTMPIRAPPVQQEVYQGQNGITYYSPQSQAAIPRQTPSRRKKVAIPIVPPPDQQGIVAMMTQPPPPPQGPPLLSQLPHQPPPQQLQTTTVAPVVAEPGSEA